MEYFSSRRTGQRGLGFEKTSVMNKPRSPWFLLAATFLACALPAAGQETTPAPDSGDTAWMLVSTVLVLMMTLPGLALFYGGLVRAKNMLNVLVQCFAAAAVVGVFWIVAGYSLAFSGDGAFFGDLSNLMLRNVGIDFQRTLPPSSGA